MHKFLHTISLFLACTGLVLGGCGKSSETAQRQTEARSDSLKILTIGTADSGGTMYPVGSALASVLSGHDEQLKVNLSASNGSYTNVENIKNGQFDMGTGQRRCGIFRLSGNGRIFRSSGRIPAGDRGRLFKPVHLDGAGIRAYLLRS